MNGKWALRSEAVVTGSGRVQSALACLVIKVISDLGFFMPPRHRDLSMCIRSRYLWDRRCAGESVLGTQILSHIPRAGEPALQLRACSVLPKDSSLFLSINTR